MFKDITNRGYRGPFNPFVQKNPTGVQVHEEQQLEALVLDVVTNDEHPEYAMDGYNVGAIKFRTLKTDAFREDSTLNWAFPLDANISEYPLVEEIVLVFRAVNRFYYTRKLNLSNRPTIHTLPGLAQELGPSLTPKDKTRTFRQSVGIPHKEGEIITPAGKYIEPKKVYRLRHDEGDIIFEGRFGQSIRMGAAWKAKSNFKSLEEDQAPNILLRVGPDTTAVPTKNSKYGLVVEDINKDQSSIYISSDQVIPLKFATESNRAHKASVSDFPSRLTGNQIVVNSSRIVLNAKHDKILGNSANGIHWTTSADFTVDVGKDYKSAIFGNQVLRIRGSIDTEANQQISIRGQRLFLNTVSSQNHPMVLGDLLAEFLSDFINAHLQNAGNYVITPTGPGGLQPGVISALTELRTNVMRRVRASFNSTTIFGS